ncbi:hypothetical protein JRQ81_003498 [Phrynocephalus forsythii]|uniref:Uncharacterized protein n=1 Tax=Phrynocephalus forsythii TaxID=171643 RepID=A0A9Q0XKQ6_9SAUR|nr:hypothetical protein JRQ81_003498 [Phrynocephalus forsythii]
MASKNVSSTSSRAGRNPGFQEYILWFYSPPEGSGRRCREDPPDLASQIFSSWSLQRPRKVMPLRNFAPSLEDLCLESVAEHLECVSDKDLMHIHFAESFVPRLIRIRRQNKSLNVAVLDRLLVPHLTTLKLDFCAELVQEALLQTIAVRCKKLTLLDLFGCNKVPAGSLVELVKALPCLTQLDLSRTKCNARVLSAVASSCRRLRELAVVECSSLSPTSLLYLAYDPVVGSFTGLALEELLAERLNHDVKTQEHIWAVAFVLLAMPTLKFLVQDFLTRAICLIYHQQFDMVQLPSGFPSLREVAQGRLTTPTNGRPLRPTLALEYLGDINRSNLPKVCAMCPNLVRVDITPESSRVWARWTLLWRSLTHLTVTCYRKEQDLRQLLIVTENLGAQLRHLCIRGFTLKDPFSFHTLLSHCGNLCDFKASFIFTGKELLDRQPDGEAMDWEVHLSPLEFLQLSRFSLKFSAEEEPLPFQYVMVLRECLVSVMKHSPLLQYMDLVRLPFPMDNVFQEVLQSPGRTLCHLSSLLFCHVLVSMDTVDLLLSSENHIHYICLKKCLVIHMEKYKEDKEDGVGTHDSAWI